MIDFKDKVVVVTGAGAGLGFGIARAFHEAGASVALGDFRQDALDRASSRLGDRVFTQVTDVRDAEAVTALFDAAEEAFGPVDITVANAAIYPSSPVLTMTQEEWDRVMETNVRGVFLTCQAAARRMVERGTRGKIITLSSGSAHSGRVEAAHYCASKAGVVMFTKVLALELARHEINVNAISPGMIEVEGEVSPLSREYIDAVVRNVPWGRAGDPQDIANAALFLASPLASYMTGEVVTVDGGATIGRTTLPPTTVGTKATA